MTHLNVEWVNPKVGGHTVYDPPECRVG
jgi:hypothetical protein